MRTADGRLAPILTHLNDDTTWLCQLPLPEPAAEETGREYYSILVDPWLAGSQVDVGRWFSEQWHARRSKVESIWEIEELIRGRNAAAAASRAGASRRPRRSNSESWQRDGLERSPVDLVVVSYEFADHCHKETLLDVDGDVPVFATKKAAHLIRSWSHFRIVKDIPDFGSAGSDWRRTSFHPLPGWVGISSIPSQGSGLSYIHGAVLISFGSDEGSAAKSILYSPHGIVPEDARCIRQAQPQLETLLLLHGANDVSITPWSWGRLNLGATNGVKLQHALRPKYWIGTHDERKTAAGIIGYLLRWHTWTVSEILKLASEQKGRDSEGENGASDEDEVNFVQVGNGESLVLR